MCSCRGIYEDRQATGAAPDPFLPPGAWEPGPPGHPESSNPGAPAIRRANFRPVSGPFPGLIYLGLLGGRLVCAGNLRGPGSGGPARGSGTELWKRLARFDILGSGVRGVVDQRVAGTLRCPARGRGRPGHDLLRGYRCGRAGPALAAGSARTPAGARSLSWRSAVAGPVHAGSLLPRARVLFLVDGRNADCTGATVAPLTLDGDPRRGPRRIRLRDRRSGAQLGALGALSGRLAAGPPLRLRERRRYDGAWQHHQANLMT